MLILIDLLEIFALTVEPAATNFGIVRTTRGVDVEADHLSMAIHRSDDGRISERSNNGNLGQRKHRFLLRKAGSSADFKSWAVSWWIDHADIRSFVTGP